MYMAVMSNNMSTEDFAALSKGGYDPTDVTIEDAMGEHPAHVSHFGYVPIADVAIEFATAEHFVHVGHIGHIPFTDATIE